MQIGIKKISPYKSEYRLTRSDGTQESITLDVKTYLLHDITHLIVEKRLGYTKGFWGMLASGFAFNELLGKDNAMTSDLRSIETIVGPVQSVFSGFIKKQDFPVYTSHLKFDISEQWLENCLEEIGMIMAEWQVLKDGDLLKLSWQE